MQEVLIGVASALALAACGGDGDPTSPPREPTVTVYALATVNGQPLPYASPILTTVRTLGDTLRLGTDGRYARAVVSDRLEPVNGQQQRVQSRQTATGAYATSGAGVVLAGVPLPFATRADGALVQTVPAQQGAQFGAPDVYVYVRLP